MNEMVRKAREYRNLNIAYVLKLSIDDKLRKNFRGQNDKLYKTLIKLAKTLPAEVVNCVLTQCENVECKDVPVENTNIKSYMKKITEIYKLSEKIKAQFKKSLNNKHPCTRSNATCSKERARTKNYIKWLDKYSKRLRDELIKLGKDVPGFETKCVVL